jgi:pimeloyl-ACP methyl ester carboxylesterase
MGGALAVLAALERPGRIESLALISPAGLPLTKPIAASAAAFVGQMLARRYPTADCIRSIGNILVAPRSALRVAQRVRALDLTQQMLRLRESGIAVRVIGCSTDTLVTASHSKRAARLLGAGYRELDVEGGHTWMFGRWSRFRSELSVHA